MNTSTLTDANRAAVLAIAESLWNVKKALNASDETGRSDLTTQFGTGSAYDHTHAALHATVAVLVDDDEARATEVLFLLADNYESVAYNLACEAREHAATRAADDDPDREQCLTDLGDDTVCVRTVDHEGPHARCTRPHDGHGWHTDPQAAGDDEYDAEINPCEDHAADAADQDDEPHPDEFIHADERPAEPAPTTPSACPTCGRPRTRQHDADATGDDFTWCEACSVATYDEPNTDGAALDEIATLAANGWALSNTEVRAILARTGR